MYILWPVLQPVIECEQHKVQAKNKKSTYSFP